MKTWLEFRDLRRVGRSDHGETYRARWDRSSGELALEILRADATDAQWLRLAKKIELTATLESRWLAKAEETGHHRGRLYLAVAWAPFGSLAQPTAGLDLERRLAALAHAARGAADLHRLGYVHRAIRPSQILVDDEGGRLSDLTWAEPIRGRSGSGPTGSLRFMAPEVARGETAGPESDVYSLAAILHHLLTGQHLHPHIPRSDVGSALRHVALTPPRISPLGSRGPELEQLLASCLSSRPDARPPSPLRVAETIEAVLHPAGDRAAREDPGAAA